MLAALGTLASVALPKLVTFVGKKLNGTRLGHAASKVMKHSDMIGRQIHHVSRHPAFQEAKRKLK